MGAAVTCDGGCGKVEPSRPSTGRRAEGELPLVLPAGWAPVRYGDHHGVVCSHTCAAEWVLGLGVDELDAGAADPDGEPHEWSPQTWIEFCKHHGVLQQLALTRAQEIATEAGLSYVGRWTEVSKYPDLAEGVRRFVLAHSATVTAQAAS